MYSFGGSRTVCVVLLLFVSCFGVVSVLRTVVVASLLMTFVVVSMVIDMVVDRVVSMAVVGIGGDFYCFAYDLVDSWFEVFSFFDVSAFGVVGAMASTRLVDLLFTDVLGVSGVGIVVFVFGFVCTACADDFRVVWLATMGWGDVALVWPPKCGWMSTPDVGVEMSHTECDYCSPIHIVSPLDGAMMRYGSRCVTSGDRFYGLLLLFCIDFVLVSC